MLKRRQLICNILVYIICCHFGLDPVTGALHVLDCVLSLVGGGNVFPGVQEGLLLHCSLLAEEDMDRGNAGEVEDVDTVLDSHLENYQTGYSMQI